MVLLFRTKGVYTLEKESVQKCCLVCERNLCNFKSCVQVYKKLDRLSFIKVHC